MPEALTLWLEKYGEMCFVSKGFGVGPQQNIEIIHKMFKFCVK